MGAQLGCRGDVLRPPESFREEPFVYAGISPPLVFCGDAYAGPKIEGAAISGLAAAEKILEDR